MNRSNTTRWADDVRRLLTPLNLPAARESEIAHELAHHLADRYAELRASGADEERARRDAIAEIDEGDLIAELARVETPRPADLPPPGQASNGPVFAGIWQDVRFGLRQLIKDRSASVVVILTLGLAIAANGIVFGLADLLLLRPLPFGNAHRLVTIYTADRTQTGGRQRVSLPDYRDLAEQSTAFERVVAIRRGDQLSLTGAGEPRAVSAAGVTVNAFTAWDVAAVAGRVITPDDDAGGDVAVLSHRFWRSYFKGDPAAVGRTIVLNGRSHQIIGVVTPDIELGSLGDIDLWVPLDPAGSAARDDRRVTAMGLLKPGVSLATANAELATVSERLGKSFPATNSGARLFAITLRESIAGSTTWVILALLALVVGLVLVVACANVATVMLARASARRREIAVRTALGATRARLIRQLVSEALLIGMCGGAAGLLLAYAGLVGFRTLSPDSFFQRLSVNANLFMFAAALSLVAPILFGVVPALRASKPDLTEDLKEGSHNASASPRGGRGRGALIVAQVGFALTVLIVSGLIVRTVISLERLPLGIDPAHVFTVRVRFDPPKYFDDAVRMRAIESIVDRLAAVPGVAAASAMQGIPIVEAEPRRRFTIAGQPAPAPASTPWAAEAATHGDYAHAFGVPLLEGRMWSAADRASNWSVVVVNREAVRRYWPGKSPIGARIAMVDATGQAIGTALELIGVVDNVVGPDLPEPPPPRIYRPLAATTDLTAVAFAVRTFGDAAVVGSSIRAALRAHDPDLAASEVQPAQRQIDDTMRTYNLVMALFVGFGLIGLIVALAGVYGVTAFAVGQRRHEIGIRVALGATARDVLRLIAGRTFRWIGIGAALGVAGGWAIGAAIRNTLFGVSAADPLTYGTALALVAACGGIAACVPAYGALSIDPVTVLKRD